MFPELKIGGWAVSTYWLSILLGVIAMGIINLLRCRRYEIKKGWSIVITLLVALGGIAGAKILFFLEQIGSANPVVKVGEGFSFFGTMFGLPLFLFLYSRIFGMRAGKFMDFCTPAIVMMFAIIKLGCFLSGCCTGIEADWGVVFPGESVPRIPAQLFEMAGALAIFAGTLLVEKFWGREGMLYPVFLGAYGVIRFCVEFVRVTEKNLAGLSAGQIFSLVSIIAAALIFALAIRKDRKKQIQRRQK